ncbi:unnamed protein product [Chrysoparadoxa australica]
MGNSSSGLPFDIGDEVVSYASSSQSHWKLYKGTKQQSEERVNIFRLDKTKTSSSCREAGQRCFSKLRSLRHPFILSCIDSAELETELVLATEQAQPLGDWLAALDNDLKHKDAQVAWGLHCVLSALKFLHVDCKVSHNNLSMDTIFVAPGGDWKLGGLDLLGPLDGSDYSIMSMSSIQPAQFQSPERRAGNWSLVNSSPTQAQDIWALGKVLEAVYSQGIPPALVKYIERMVHEIPKKRPTANSYLTCAYLKQPCVKSMEFFESYHVKTAAEKEAFFSAGSFDASLFPPDALANKVGACIVSDLQRSITNAAAAKAGGGSGNAGVRSAVQMLLPPLLSCTAEMEEGPFRATVEPALVRLFAVNDRGIRVMLLSKLDSFASRFEKETVNKLFDPLCAGFTDGAAALRELTLKAMVALVDQLSEKNLNEKLVRHLQRLQRDPEDSIRTNTIILLGRLAGRLKESVRDKVLLQAFSMGVRDGFPAARLAGIRATAACHAYFKPQMVCRSVLPAMVTCLIDPQSAAVRDAAFTCVNEYIQRLQEVSESMKVAEEEQRKKQMQERQASGEKNEAGAAGAVPSPPVSGDGKWGMWAMKSISAKLLASSLNADANGGEIGGATLSRSSSGNNVHAASAAGAAGDGGGASTGVGKPPNRTALPQRLPQGLSVASGGDDAGETWADARENEEDGWDDFDDTAVDDFEPAPPAAQAKVVKTGAPYSSGSGGGNRDSLNRPSSGMKLTGTASAGGTWGWEDSPTPPKKVQNTVAPSGGGSGIMDPTAGSAKSGSVEGWDWDDISGGGASSSAGNANPTADAAAGRAARRAALQHRREQRKADMLKLKKEQQALAVTTAAAAASGGASGGGGDSGWGDDGWDDF